MSDDEPAKRERLEQGRNEPIQHLDVVQEESAAIDHEKSDSVVDFEAIDARLDELRKRTEAFLRRTKATNGKSDVP